MNETLLYAFAVTVLLASGGLAALCVFGSARVPFWLDRSVFALGLVTAGVLLYSTLFQIDGMHFGFAVGLMCVVWVAAVVAFVEGFVDRVPFLEMFIFPLCALVFLLELLVGEESHVPMAMDWLFQAHLLIAISAYSLLGLAAVHSIVMAYQEKMLHQPLRMGREGQAKRERMLDHLPSLISMESILFRQLWAGFVLLSLTLISGFLFSEQWSGHAFRFDHKTLFSVVSWVSFAVLLGGRLLLGWRGKVALRWCLGSYVMLFLAYFGTQFVLEFILKRAV